MIRPATVQDAAAIASIQARAWRHGYAEIVEPDQMPDVSRTEPWWRERLVQGDADALVFDQDGALAGFAVAGADRWGGEEGELYAIYVDPPAQGAGVGSALLAAAVEALRDGGFAAARLWVLEANGLARAFYERHGWRLDDGRQERMAGLPEVRYRRALPARA